MYLQMIIPLLVMIINNASSNMFQNDSNIRHFAHTPFVHYPIGNPRRQSKCPIWNIQFPLHDGTKNGNASSYWLWEIKDVYH